MPRKAVADGGKREEIIQKAMLLFFENGYEATSVRMILDQVNGEVGMFYHYFKSKEELFQQVVDYFYKDYENKFESVVSWCSGMNEMIQAFLEQYRKGVEGFMKLAPRMHWTIQYAMAGRTLQTMLPFVIRAIGKIEHQRKVPDDILGGQLLYAISATVHSQSFRLMSEEEQYQSLTELASIILGA